MPQSKGDMYCRIIEKGLHVLCYSEISSSTKNRRWDFYPQMRQISTSPLGTVCLQKCVSACAMCVCGCMCVCMDVCTCVHVCAHTCVHVCVHISVCVYVYVKVKLTSTYEEPCITKKADLTTV